MAPDHKAPGMSPEMWRRVDAVLLSALELHPAACDAFLDRACSGDPELRREVESLLAAERQAGTAFLAEPALALVSRTGAEPAGRPPEKVGPYRIVRRLGAGGMGEVYLAHDTRLGRDLALKILSEEFGGDDQRRARFRMEARVASALNHPNIATIYDVGEEGDLVWLAMEHVEGETLEAAMGGRPLPIARLVSLAAQVADALDAAHRRGIIHRDVKPRNIMVTPSDQAKVLDFGLAKMRGSPNRDAFASGDISLTLPGTVLGTLAYMSPEQALGRELDQRTDLFSFGAVLYEMATGRVPFLGATGAEVIRQILETDPEPIPRASPTAPAGLARVVSRCLEKDRERRYGSAAELRADILALALEPGRPARTKRRRGAALRVASLAGLGVGLVLAGLRLRWRAATEAPIALVAVLPFDHNGDGAASELLGDGFTEDIINGLAQVPGLRVMARNTVFRYSGGDFDPRRFGRELKVPAVVTGRLRQEADDLGIGVELVRVADGVQLWGKRYRRKIEEAPALQRDITREIAGQLRLEFGEDQERRASRRHSGNPAAYQEYLRGRYHALKWTAEGFRTGIKHLHRAIDTDPAYALAYAGLAATYYDASGVWLRPEEAMTKARANALRALELDEELAEAHTSLAQVKSQYDWDWEGAERAYRRALELNPNLSAAHLYYGIYLQTRGRLESAKLELDRAYELDPLTPFIGAAVAFERYLMGELDPALELARTTVETAPDFYTTRWVLGLVHQAQGRPRQAMAAFREAVRLDPGNPFLLGFVGWAEALAGRSADARRTLAELRRSDAERFVDPVAVAMVHAGLGERDAALAALEEARLARSENLLFYKDAQPFADLRRDPRFGEVYRRMGLAPGR